MATAMRHGLCRSSGLTNIQLEVSEKIQLLADESTYAPLPLIDHMFFFTKGLSKERND